MASIFETYKLSVSSTTDEGYIDEQLYTNILPSLEMAMLAVKERFPKITEDQLSELGKNSNRVDVGKYIVSIDKTIEKPVESLSLTIAGDGGVSIEITDKDGRANLKLHGSHYGSQLAGMEFDIEVEALKKLAEMFERASKYDFKIKVTDYGAKVY